ncbi:MAG TPA: alpha-ketoacid dehydrogenase subunit beta, partial [Porphyromonadaceae bacterium]|nr:alpha-ketoacid dehydrogenase subunit beta [Porphyromonadaceae bacterium]
DPEFVLPIGKADIKKEGKDITVITYGRMLERVVKAANEVEEAEGVSVEVVDLRTLAPLDKEAILESVKKTGKVLLVNDAHKTGGFIGEVAAMIAESDAFDYLDNRILRLAADDIPVPYNHILESAMLPDVERIKKYILKLVNKR